MVKEKFILSIDLAEARAKEEGAESAKKEMAKKMILKNKSIEEIEEFTGLRLKTLKEIAASVGCSLVL